MTSAAAPPEQTGTGQRLPVRPAIDADFSASALAELAATATRTTDPVSAAVLAAANQARLWQLPCDPAAASAVTAAATQPSNGLDAGADLQLLHRFETSEALRPPAFARTEQLDPLTALAWLLVARRWAERSDRTRDWRYLNTACKVLGAVWHRCDDAPPADSAWREPRLFNARAALAQRIITACAGLRQQFQIPHPSPAAPPAPPQINPSGRIRTAVLARVGSSTAIRFQQQAAERGILVAGTCWYDRHQSPDLESNYTDAWYPPAPRTLQAVDRPPRKPKQQVASSWDDAAARLRLLEPDILVLLGMPIVPTHILDVARVAVLNAHNGALPGYRGMDAVGWAVLNGDPVTCTVHHATPHVDAGDVIASAVVPATPWPGLRERVKATQLELLLSTIQAADHAGGLPAATAQSDAGARLWFRMHPHLKRLLDRLVTSPLTPPATSAHHQTQGADA